MPQPPTETVEAACRAWWDATGPTGKRIASCTWDEWVARAKQENAPPQYQQSVDDYRRRMIFALQAAVGLP
jgi:hypothetical protein